MWKRLFAKFFMTATAIAPMLILRSLYELIEGRVIYGCIYIAVFAVIFCSFILLFRFARNQHERIRIQCENIKPIDGEPIAFLLAYSLPFLCPMDGAMRNVVVQTAFIITCIVCVYCSNSWTFNPIFTLCGFHFYEIQEKGCVPFVLISRRIFREAKQSVSASQIDEYIYLDTEK